MKITRKQTIVTAMMTAASMCGLLCLLHRQGAARSLRRNPGAVEGSAASQRPQGAPHEPQRQIGAEPDEQPARPVAEIGGRREDAMRVADDAGVFRERLQDHRANTSLRAPWKRSLSRVAK